MLVKPKFDKANQQYDAQKNGTFLAKSTFQQNLSQSNYDRINILQELKIEQQENFKLLGNMQELKGKIAYLMSILQEQKTENKYSAKIRIEYLEKKFNQFAD